MSTKKILIICTILSILSGCKNNEPVTKATDELKGYPIKMFAEWKWEGELTENMEIILKDIKKTWETKGGNLSHIFYSVVTNEEQLNILRRISGKKIDADFNRNDVLAVVAFSNMPDIIKLEFSEIRETDNKRQAYITARIYTGAMVQMVVPNAKYHIVEIKKENLPVEFSVDIKYERVRNQ